MKLTNTLFALIFALTFTLVSCNKEESLNQADQKEATKINLMPIDFSDWVRPDVPPYVEEDDASGSPRGVINVAPGSNQLQAIINAAKKNSTINLLPGMHSEDETIVINHKVKLTGDEGAVLSLDGFVGVLITGANGTEVSNLEIINQGNSGLGVAAENSSHVEVSNNDFSGFLYSVALEQTDHAKVKSNIIIGTTTNGGLGVTVINGDHVKIIGNEVSVNQFGIWACDKKGKCINNTTHDNLIGIILCKVPAGTFPLGNGSGGSEFPGYEWTVTNNTSYNNVWGYLAVDGAHHNTLSNNYASNNAKDMELAGVTMNTFPFTTPTSHNNTVNIGGAGIDVIDCGLDNVVHGGIALPGPCAP